MAYWWVSQNRTFEEEKNGGYLWAPIKTKTGGAMHHWNSMSDLREGDIVFSYVGQKIVAMSTVTANAYQCENPFLKDGEEWENEGRKVDLSYKLIQPPIILRDIVDELQVYLEKQQKYSPLNRNGTGNQGYLFPLIDKVGEFLFSRA